jgi:hypothetical protein
VVDCLPTDKAEALPVRLCATIAALPHTVTASLGAAIVPFTGVVDPATASLNWFVSPTPPYIEQRAGGNRVVAEVTDTVRD